MYHVVTIKVTAENGITNKEYKVIAKKIKDGNSEDEEENEGGLESNTEKTEEVSNEIDENNENDESKDEILDEENVNLNKENEKEQNNFIVIGIVVGVLIIAFIIYMIRKKKK